MTIIRGFLIIAISTAICAMIGAWTGYKLGIVAPGYYRWVFRNGGAAQFDPVEVGFGLGLTQGMVAGLAVGCVVVLSVAWYNSRRQVMILPSEPAREPRSDTALEQSQAIRSSESAR